MHTGPNHNQSTTDNNLHWSFTWSAPLIPLSLSIKTFLSLLKVAQMTPLLKKLHGNDPTACDRDTQAAAHSLFLILPDLSSAFGSQPPHPSLLSSVASLSLVSLFRGLNLTSSS